MKAKTVAGAEIELSQDVFNGWKARLRGPVLGPVTSERTTARRSNGHDRHGTI